MRTKQCPYSAYPCPHSEFPECELCLQYLESKAKRNLDMDAEIERGVRAVYAGHQDICRYCGTELNVEREVFGGDPLWSGHSCRGSVK